MIQMKIMGEFPHAFAKNKFEIKVERKLGFSGCSISMMNMNFNLTLSSLLGHMSPITTSRMSVR